MRGRFAPSPTGTLHLGNLRTALVAWLYARSTHSGFVLRFEDLDAATVRTEHYDSQRRDLDRLGLDWDTELRQSEHEERYRALLAELTSAGLTYPCYCTRREIREAASAPNARVPDGAYPGTCRTLTSAQRAELEADGRTPALRLRAQAEEIRFDDGVHGPVTGAVDDLVLARRDGVPAYNLVVVVDDHHQRVEQVVRADDLLSSTPRQIHVGRLLGLADLSYAHVPLVLGPDGSRLAKRDGAVTLDDRLAMGETLAGVRGRLAASIGLAPEGTQPSPEELVAGFDAARLHRAPWVMSPDEL